MGYRAENYADVTNVPFSVINSPEIRKKCGAIFFHYTYKPNHCTCCFDIRNQPSRYWENGEILEDANQIKARSYFIFGNAENTIGAVKAKDFIGIKEFINYNITSEHELQRFMDAMYEVLYQYGFRFLIPPNTNHRLVMVNRNYQIGVECAERNVAQEGYTAYKW